MGEAPMQGFKESIQAPVGIGEQRLGERDPLPAQAWRGQRYGQALHGHLSDRQSFQSGVDEISSG
jgi:hypothetical protein